jgi:hypothetical protein
MVDHLFFTRGFGPPEAYTPYSPLTLPISLSPSLSNHLRAGATPACINVKDCAVLLPSGLACAARGDARGACSDTLAGGGETAAWRLSKGSWRRWHIGHTRMVDDAGAWGRRKLEMGLLLAGVDARLGEELERQPSWAAEWRTAPLGRDLAAVGDVRRHGP